VKKNIDEGMSHLKEKKAKEDEKNKVTVDKLCVFKFKGTLQKIEKKDEDQKIKSMLSEG
jgi:hypothetical protein